MDHGAPSWNQNPARLGSLRLLRAIQHLVLRAGGDGHDLIDQLFLNLQFFEGFLEILGYGLEMSLVQPWQVGVGCAQILASPWNWAAQRGGEELLLAIIPSEFSCTEHSGRIAFSCMK